ncbi:hypothetical protein PS2_020049 [Malus domestica]
MPSKRETKAGLERGQVDDLMDVQTTEIDILGLVHVFVEELHRQRFQSFAFVGFVTVFCFETSLTHATRSPQSPISSLACVLLYFLTNKRHVFVPRKLTSEFRRGVEMNSIRT